MIFEERPTDQSLGALLVHAIRLPGITIKKGTTLTDRHISIILTAGIKTLWVAVPENEDMHEDEAAATLADALQNTACKRERAFTGRANLFAAHAGLFQADRHLIDAFNRVDPAITLASLGSMVPVEAGRMVATVKIIPFAVNRQKIKEALALLGSDNQALTISPFKRHRIGVLSTTLPHLKPTVIDKTLKVLQDRLSVADAAIVKELRVTHTVDAIASGIESLSQSDVDFIILFGASAIADRRDVIPAGLERAGGSVLHFGMPVDPGNLLLLGRLNSIPVLGAPGCARSPKENGFDWVLQRLLADVEVGQEMVTGLGVGGLLMDIVSRPIPRSGITGTSETSSQIGALILAAGRSSRMGGPNKLLAEFDGKPLIRLATENALASNANPVTIVTGHMHEAIENAVAGLNVNLVHNSEFAHGLSTSLRAGIAALPPELDAALIMLADMPGIGIDQINTLIRAYSPLQGTHIVVPTDNGKRGNPVIWSRRYFSDLTSLSGDIGARHIIEASPEAVVEIELGQAARLDVDTPEMMSSAGGILTES
ncbi:MAG: molybdopterin-binding/glycosyltransferase family 2 protein [Stappiaceae bacterium]